MLIAIFPVVLLVLGLVIWIVSAKAVDWPTIGRVMFVIGLAVVALIASKATFHLL